MVEESVEVTATEPQQVSTGSRGFVGNAVGSFALNVVNVAVTLLTTILLARIMGVSDYGVYAFVVATVTVLGIPAISGVDRLLTRDIAVHTGSAAFGLARGLLHRMQQLTLGVSISIALVAGVVAWAAAGGQVSAPLIAFWLGLASLPFLALGRIVQGALMGLHYILLAQSAEFVLRPTLLLALALVFAAGGIVLSSTVAIVLQGLSLVVACVASVILLRLRTPKAVRVARPEYETRRWVSAAVSLGLLSGATLLNSQVGVLLLGVMNGSESAGLYSVAQRGALLVAFPLAAVSTAIAPTAARLWAAHDPQRLQRMARHSARGALIACLPLVGIYLLFGQEILTVFFGPEFAAASAALAILALGQLANVATGPVATLLVMTGHERNAVVGIAVGAVLNIVLAVALIPSLDTAGAALAAAIGIAISNVILVVISKRRLAIWPMAFGLPRRSEGDQ